MSQKTETAGRLINAVILWTFKIWTVLVYLLTLLVAYVKSQLNKSHNNIPERPKTIVHKKRAEERPLSASIFKKTSVDTSSETLTRRVTSENLHTPQIEKENIITEIESPRKKKLSNIVIIGTNDLELKKRSSGKEEYMRKGELNTRMSVAREATELDLSDFAFVLLPFKLRSCMHLHTLDLSYNKLSTLPTWFYNNMSPTLRRLNLAGNLFFELAPAFITIQLEELNLSYNKFEYFPNVILDIPTLEAISIHHNSLFTVPAEISKLKKLRHLNIAHNLLSRLPDELVQCTNLKELQIHGNHYIGSNQKILQALYDKNPDLERAMMLAEERDLEGSTNRKKRTGTVASASTPKTPVTPSPTATPTSPRDESPNESRINEKRVHGLLEILESERKYTRYITLLYSQYYLPLTKDSPLPNVTISPPQLRTHLISLPQDTVRQLFPPGLVQIVNFNTSLLSELNRLIEVPQTAEEAPSPAKINASMIGPLFIERAPFLKLYTSYVSQYEHAHKVLSECFATYPFFKTVIEEGTKLSESNGLALSDLMIMPIQRIPRYLLLLQAVFQHTPSSHPDYENLKKAMEKVQDVASYVNKKIEETSNRNKVIELADELGMPNIIEPHRHYIRESKFKISNEDNREFKVFLLSDVIIMKEAQSLLQGIRMYSINSILTGASVRKYSLEFSDVIEDEDLAEDEFKLQVTRENKEKRIYRFTASSEQVKKLWVSKLKELITKARSGGSFK
jgi:Leucine-rich repeat (LRR) protein